MITISIILLLPFFLTHFNQLLASSLLPLTSVMLTFSLRSNVQFSVLILLEIVDHCFVLETLFFSLGFQAPTRSCFLLAPLALSLSALFILLPFPNFLNNKVSRVSSWSTFFLSLSSLISNLKVSNTFHILLSP